MRQNSFNVVFFVLLAGGLTVLWWYADQNWFPKKDIPKKEVAAERKDGDAARKPAEKPTPEAVAALAGAVSYGAAEPPPPAPKVEAKQPTPPPPAAAPQEPVTLIALGGPGFANQYLLSTRGAGVQRVLLPWFNESNRLGEEAKDEAGRPVPLHLIPGVPRPRGRELKDDSIPASLAPGLVADPRTLAEASYLLFHYASPDDKYPSPLLGEVNWRVAEESRPEGGEHRVVFETELGEPHFVKIRKTYALKPTDYHVALRLEFGGLPGRPKGKGLFRYQVSGPRGLPVEGEWYTYTYRVALIGWETKSGVARRQYEDAATVAVKRGGEAAQRADNTFKYAAIATQYFTSALAIDPTVEGAAKHPWEYVRATTELPFDKPTDPQMPYFDDVTFRAVSEPLDLAPEQKVTHAYVIYNGPAKVRLLKLLRDDRAVDGGLVDWYHDTLGLRTVTDYRSPTALGWFADKIYWSDLVIVFTNLMHWLLWVIHLVIRDWGLSIIALTVIVRLMLFFPSRKQTQMNLRMMEIQKKLQPELERLHEKYKDDFHAYNREKTRLMMQHGMNPFAAMGGCLLLLAQMPIMMGLYFGLQESVFFRLEPFLWIENLSAPDMSVWWTERIPYVSTPEDIGSFLYLGPYLNILPLIAVGLMLYQQNKMMPPPTDEQMAAQQRMMKIMMILVAVMFYKVAAGLALYFIISTAWGLVERQFIPKPEDKPGDDSGSTAGLLPAGGSPNGTAAPERPKGLLGRLRESMRKKLEELQKQAEEQASRQARNPNRNEPIRNPDQRPDRRDKKKRRK